MKRKPLSLEHKRKISIAHKRLVGDKACNWKGGNNKCIDCGKRTSTRYSTRCRPCGDIFYKEENANAWRGDDVGTHGVHAWVEKWKGTPSRCEICGTTEDRIYDWANIDHKYRRVLDDYIRVCRSCHRNYDIENLNYKNLRKEELCLNT